MRARPLRVVAATAAAIGATTALTWSAHAEVALMSTGSFGIVELLNFSGGKEALPLDGTDVGEASVECDPLTRGRRAVFAGALAWAPDVHAGLANDWQYVRVVAGAADDEGQVLTGEISPFYPAYDDRPAILPAVGVLLPDDSTTYTPLLMVQFFDSTYELAGTSMVASQSGAWRDGDSWEVAHADLVRCD